MYPVSGWYWALLGCTTYAHGGVPLGDAMMDRQRVVVLSALIQFMTMCECLACTRHPPCVHARQCRSIG